MIVYKIDSFIQQRWRSTPRFVKLYLSVVFIGFTLFFAFLAYSTPSSPINEVPGSTAEGNVKLISELDVKSALRKASDAVTDRRTVKKSLTNDRKINWESDLKNPSIRPNKKQLEIINAMKHTWMGYTKYAWGDDNLKPISKTSHTWFGLGLTIVDSLDTLLLMGLEKEYNESLDWVRRRFTTDVNRYVNCFEVTIRVLGGFLSAYHLTENSVFLDRAKEVGDKLIHCYDSPVKTVPFSDLNLALNKARGPFWSPDSSLSEVTSLQLEFRDLSRITGSKRYEIVAFRTSQHIHNLTVQSGDPLLPMYISPITGRFT
ncbi:endoplasmic reticulum mannosyl-oligosaccharide 1:2-alpha-mannosidase-like protein, partial [Leptotrombidium deliense]